MDCVSQLPMWAQPVLSVPSFGAAQFTAASGSTIELTSRLPNIFGNAGDYVEFMFFQASASAWTVFGSTVSPDAIILDGDTITITDGTASDSITLLASLSTTEWNHIRLIRNGSTIECYVATGSDSLVLELQTLDVIPLDLDIVGKNQDAFTDVIAVKLAGYDGDYLTNATPSAALQGSDSGWWRNGWFYLDSVGNHPIAGTMNGNYGWSVEVENVYLSQHRLVFKVGNGTEIKTLKSDETFSMGQWINFHVDLEDLLGAEPDAGDTTIDGFETNADPFYVGTTYEEAEFFDGKVDSLFGGDGSLTSAQITWLYNDGYGRVVDEIGAGTTVATGDIDFGWAFDETSGTRLDSFGSDDLTENAGSPFSDGFEAVTGGSFDNWTTSVSGSTTVNVESSTVRSGTYSARVDLDGSANDGRLINDVTTNLTPGKEYTISVWAGATATGPSFRIQPNASFDAVDKTISSTSFTEYTHTFTAFGVDLRIVARTGANESIFFDDISISSSNVISAAGLRTSFTTAAAFTGYLKNVYLNAAAGYVEIPLITNANDIGGDSNNGTATNVTFVTEDPAA